MEKGPCGFFKLRLGSVLLSKTKFRKVILQQVLLVPLGIKSKKGDSFSECLKNEVRRRAGRMNRVSAANTFSFTHTLIAQRVISLGTYS